MNYGLTCNFTLQPSGLSQGLGVAFQSADGGASYGGGISIQTPATAGPVVTGLWDSDGNVFFKIYTGDDPDGPNCVINSGSTPGSFTPYIVVASQSGLDCQIVPEGGDGDTYNYTLQISAGTTAVAATPLGKQRPSAS